jgi:hypothetical protein
VVETYPRFVHAKVRFPGKAEISVAAWPLVALKNHGTGGNPHSPPSAMFELACPVDSGHIDLWSVVSEMITKHDKKRQGKLPCSGATDESGHTAEYEIRIKY